MTIFNILILMLKSEDSSGVKRKYPEQLST